MTKNDARKEESYIRLTQDAAARAIFEELKRGTAPISWLVERTKVKENQVVSILNKMIRLEIVDYRRMKGHNNGKTRGFFLTDAAAKNESLTVNSARPWRR